MTLAYTIAAAEFSDLPAAEVEDRRLVDPEEAACIARAKDDPEAFAILYRKHRRTIWSYLFRRTGSRDAADDLLAEVFLAALDRIGRFEHRGVPFICWLYGIATNIVNRHIRRARRHHTARPAEHDLTADSSAADDRLMRVRQALDALHPDRQAVIVLHYLEGLTQRQIAAALKLREGTVRSRLARGLRDLRRAVQKEESS